MTVAAIGSGQVDSASGASSTEAVAAIVAIVLTILGLAHVAPNWLVAIATIAAGVAVGFQGLAVARLYAGILSQSGDQAVQGADIGGGLWAIEFIAGAAGIVLGILALLGIVPTLLVAVAAIAVGGALVLGSGSVEQLNTLRLAVSHGDEATRRLMGGMAVGSAGIQVVSGLAAIVLGILALIGFSPVVLVLIALLQLGAFMLINGSVGSSMMMNLLHR